MARITKTSRAQKQTTPPATAGQNPERHVSVRLICVIVAVVSALLTIIFFLAALLNGLGTEANVVRLFIALHYLALGTTVVSIFIAIIVAPTPRGRPSRARPSAASVKRSARERNPRPLILLGAIAVALTVLYMFAR